jgi:ATPase subunit of ABC transporter with duplicated ATPase domains
MLVSINVEEKSFGDKLLYDDLTFDIEAGEKVGLIGRNGTGKSTLLHMITGEDIDFQGDIDVKRGTVIITSRQEHHGHEAKTVLSYIQGDLPEFEELEHIIQTYPATMGDNPTKIQRYTDALDRYGHLGYFEIEDQLTQAFDDYQLDASKLHGSIDELSGGQKRMVELIKVQRARGHLALIDEPTNHMDYVAKQAFIKWLAASYEAVVVVTHDRDVLSTVDKIVEIRNGRAYTFKGNYAHYLQINANQITSQVNEYDLIQRRIQNLQTDIIRFRRLKEKAHDPGTIKRFKSSEQKAEAELAKLSGAEQPSFWIDRENADELTPKITSAYQKYKARNISLSTRSQASQSSRLLIEARNLSLGYGSEPLFQDINFSLHEGERIRLHGRNGAGKTTLVNAVMSKITGQPMKSDLLAGTIAVENELTVGLYEQEIDKKYLPMTLKAAIEHTYMEKDVPIGDQKVKKLLGDYLFNPAADGDTPVSRLSGGQKARFQLIRMLANDPIVLILDEPTNHLDLPSIEELEDAMTGYHGAVIYISHDSYFAKKLGGETVEIGK